jgi:hypothetical protein
MVMANIFIKCGKYPEAIQMIDKLLSLEGYYTVNNFKLDIMCEPIRDLPEFQMLMNKYQLHEGS